ncbi:MAG: hypothetical protein QOD68_3432 [Actinomycetota bacterium]|jgi:hypothetical protein|nr:hypothetical protein [Actinomycetota bacterium]
MLAAAAAIFVAALAVPVSLGLLARDDRTTAAPMTDAQAAARLRGVWVTPVVSREQVAAVLSDAGLAAHIDAVVLNQNYPTAWNMTLGKNGAFDVRSQTGVQVDVGQWLVDDGVLVLRPTSCPSCQIRLAFHLEHGMLRLELISDNGPDIDGVPEQAYARALYTAAPFTRFVQPTP